VRQPLINGTRLVRLVNPYVGTDSTLADQGTGGSAGNMSPAATAPFGMLSWGPRTLPDATAFGAGYTHSDHVIDGFDLTRFQGGGCVGFGDVPMVPTTQTVSKSPAKPASFGLDPSLEARFSHRHESASPGRYSVTLDPDSPKPIRVRLAAASRAGVGRVRFPRSGRVGSLVINAGGSQTADDVSKVRVYPARRTVVVSLVSGRFCEQPTTYHLHVVMRFDRAFASHATWSRQTFHEGGTAASSTALVGLSYTPGAGLPPSLPGDPSGTAQAGAVLRFHTAHQRAVGVRVGLSYVSRAGARRALHREVAGRSLRQVRHRTSARWARRLGRIRVAGGSQPDRRMLATTLYQSLLSPQLISDVDGRYPSLGGGIRRARSATYSQMSLWDEYRTHAQLLAVLAPHAARDMARSLLHDERDAGFMPRWPVVGGSPDIMVGDPAVPFIADLKALGVPGINARAATRAAVHGAASNGIDDQDPGTLPAAGDPKTFGGGYYVERPGNPAFLRSHYVPVELDTTTNTTGGALLLASPDIVWGSASTSLEYATADFATARLARQACRAPVARRFAARSQWWHNDFDPDTRYVEPRSETGSFQTGGETGNAHGFVEGDGSQYTFMVPFDVAGLRKAIGGRSALVHRLDTLFTKLNAGPNSPYAFLGNEPGLGTPYEYLWAGRPDRTESVIHRALNSMYAPTPAGYPGNVDGGTMSAWWAFNALGVYPVTPGTSALAVGAPRFARIMIRLPRGGTVRINAPGARGSRPYVASAGLGRHALSRAWVRLGELRRAGVLHVHTTGVPSRWADRASAAPPSYDSSVGLPARCR
jgi:predicted alpha-1,2-mannosidase